MNNSLNGGEIQSVLQGLIKELQKYLLDKYVPNKESNISKKNFAKDPVFDTEKCNFLKTHYREKFWEAKRLKTQLRTQRTEKILRAYPFFRDIYD